MFSNKRNLSIMKKFLGTSLSNSKSSVRLFNLLKMGVSVKGFSAHGTNQHGDNHGHGNNNGHTEHLDEHDDHHGHHEITGEVDLNKVYVPLSANRSKYISLIGVPNNHKHVKITIENTNKACDQITPISIPLITRSRVYFKDLANVSYEENPYFHPEPYGYLISDDPFDSNPSVYQTLYLIAIAFFAFMLVTRIFRMNNFGDYKALSQEIYHAHYTANLIEDQIRQIRKEDYQWRKRYDDVKKENMGESQ